VTRTIWQNLQKQPLCCIRSTSRIVSSSYVLFLSVIQDKSESEDYCQIVCSLRRQHV
jgi:hypothetical protein